MKEFIINKRTYYTKRENIKHHYKTFIFFDKKLLRPVDSIKWSSKKEETVSLLTQFLNKFKREHKIKGFKPLPKNKYGIEKVIDRDGNEFFITANSEKERMRQLEILIDSDEYSSANAEDIEDFISVGDPTEHEYQILNLVALKAQYGK